MKRFIKRWPVLMAFSILLTLAAFSVNGEAAAKFTTGAKVAAKWTDGEYYLAVIKSFTDGNYEVDYDDGSQGTVAEADIQSIPAKLKLAAGDKVYAVWSGSKFYPGTVEKTTAKGAVVKWDDGSQPSMVEFGKIFKP